MAEVNLNLKLVPGNITEDAKALGLAAARAFEAAFKPSLTGAFQGQQAQPPRVGLVTPQGQPIPTQPTLAASSPLAGMSAGDLGKAIGQSLSVGLSESISRSLGEGLRQHLTTTRPTAPEVEETPARRTLAQHVERAGQFAIRSVGLIQALTSSDPLTALFILEQTTLQKLGRPGGGEGGEGHPAARARPRASLGQTAIQLQAGRDLARGALGAGEAAATEVAGAGAVAEGAELGGVARVAAAGRFAGLGSALGPAGIALALGGHELVKGLGEAAEGIESIGVNSANTGIRYSNMARIMGVSTAEFLQTREIFAGSGIDLDQFQRAILRMTLTASKELPDINKQYADSARQISEANIKVRDSSRGVTEAQLDQQDQQMELTKAQEQAAETRLLGPERRAERLQGARLGVTGAAIGVEAAGMQLEGADIQQRFARREEALQTVEAQDTSAGARLGLRGARLQLRQAQGENVTADRAQLQLDIAKHNVGTAQSRVERADIAEETTEARRIQGLGPVGQADLQERQAAQAAVEADLRMRTARTALATEELRQVYLKQQAEQAQAERGVRRAQLGVEGAPDRIQLAQIAAERAPVALESIRLQQVPELERALEQTRQGQQPELSLQRFGPEAVRSLILRQASQRPGGAVAANIMEALSEYVRTAAPAGGQNADQIGITALGAVAGSPRILGPLESQIRLLGLLRQTPEQRAERITPEQREGTNRLGRAIDENLPDLNKTLEDIRTTQEQLSQQRLAVGVTPSTQEAARTAAGALEGVESISIKLQEAGVGVADGITNAGSAIIEALRGTASGIEGAGHGAAAPTPAPATGPSGAEGASHAGGGLITGPGSSTSDSIPIRASAGEYIIRASTVSRVGTPFLDSLNARRFGEGGFVLHLAEGGPHSMAGTPLPSFGTGSQDAEPGEEGRLLAGQYTFFWRATGKPKIPTKEWNAVIRAGLNPQDAFDHEGHLTEKAKAALQGTPAWAALTQKALEGLKVPEIRVTEPAPPTPPTPSMTPTPSLDPKLLHPSGQESGAPDEPVAPRGPTILRGGQRQQDTRGVTVLRGDQRTSTPGATDSYAGGSHMIALSGAFGREPGTPWKDEYGPPAFASPNYVPQAPSVLQPDLTWKDLPRASSYDYENQPWSSDRYGLAEGGSVPAMVSNGEYRMSAPAVAHWGRGFMDLLNNGGVQRQFGGNVTTGPALASALGFSIHPAQLHVSQAEAWAGLGPSNYGIRTPQPSLASLGINAAEFQTPRLTAGQQADAARMSALLSSIDLGTGGGSRPAQLGREGTFSGPTEGFSLDLRTPAGVFTVHASQDTMAAIQMSSIGSQLSSAGTRPSWYS